MQRDITAKTEEIFHEVYVNFWRSVSYYAFDLLGDVEDAKDITADAFLKVWKKQKDITFNSASEMSSYVFVCAKHACFNRLKSIKRRKRLEEGFQFNNMMSHIEIFELRADSLEMGLVNAMRSLEVKYRESIQLYYFENMTCAEISSLLNLSEDTIRYRLKRGKKIIKEALRINNKPTS